MNRKIAKEILNMHNKNSVFKLSENKTIQFARQQLSDIDDIENYSNEELVKEWKSLVYLNEIYGCVSINDLERIQLLELEIESREIDTNELDSWYDKAQKEFDKQGGLI